jgi:hypothetical protein
MVAVKQLAQDGVQGSHEFLIEVLMLTMLNHKNLVCLVGFCAQGDERLLVYEYMPFGSLESHLFGKLLFNFLCMFGQFRFLSVLAQTTHLRWNVCLSFLFLLCYSATDSIVCCRKTKSLFPPFFPGYVLSGCYYLRSAMYFRSLSGKCLFERKCVRRKIS